MGNTLTFVASRGKALLLLLGSICFVALGVWMASEMPFLGWLAVAFFGLGIPVSLLMLLPRSTSLRLDEQGFEMRSFFRRHRFNWTDVADFRIASIHGAKMIGIIFHPEYKRQQLGRSVAATLSGMEAAIPNQYNATLEQVFEALTVWRQRYGRAGAPSPSASGSPSSGGEMSAFPWQLLLLKLAAFLSFCGGPLVVVDSLKVHLDKDVAFAIAFLPTVALIFGVYSLWLAIHDRWDNVMVLIGGAGALALLGMDVFAVLELATGPERADEGLIKLGIAIGIAFVTFYAYASHKFFRLPRTAG